MAYGLPYLILSSQTICDIAALHASTGDPVKHLDHKRGRKQVLTATEVDVSCTKIFPQCRLSTHSSFYMAPSAATMTPTSMSCRSSWCRYVEGRSQKAQFGGLCKEVGIS